MTCSKPRAEHSLVTTNMQWICRNEIEVANVGVTVHVQLNGLSFGSVNPHNWSPETNDYWKSSLIATRGSLNTINWPIEAWLDVHYKFVRLLTPSSFEVKSDGCRANLIRLLTCLLMHSSRWRSCVSNLQGAPGGQNHDIHLMFLGPRLQHGY